MNNRVIYQLTAFLTFILNHIYYLFYSGAFNKGWKGVVMVLLVLLFSVLFFGDYQFFFRKKKAFSVSPFVYLLYGGLIWLGSGNWFMIAVNLAIMVLYILIKRKEYKHKRYLQENMAG